MVRDCLVRTRQIMWTAFMYVVSAVTLPLMLYWMKRTFRPKKFFRKVVLITGASSGLGEALAVEFYLAGHKVILASRRKEELERVKDKLLTLKTANESSAFTPHIVVVDLSDLESIEEKAKQAEAIYGHIDILINNGGVSFRGDVENTDIKVHVDVMKVNYFGQIALTKALLPGMINEGGGHIVAISSVQGRIAIPHRSAYAASKHALSAYMDCLRAEVAAQGIKVTTVNPGYIKTNISLNALTGSGDTYGVTDLTTADGYHPLDVAQRILKAVKTEENEVTISDLKPKLAILLRAIFPNVYFYIMGKRALNSS